MSKPNNEFKECGDCVYKDYCSPSPCDSCEQPSPSNFTEVKE